MRENMKERSEAAEAELLAVREDNHSMMLEIDGLRTERDALAAELAKLREQKPVAWMHDKGGRVDTCHDSVKELWLKVGKSHNTQFMREIVPCRVEHYTIPLYARPVPAPAVPAVQDCTTCRLEDDAYPGEHPCVACGPAGDITGGYKHWLPKTAAPSGASIATPEAIARAKNWPALPTPTPFIPDDDTRRNDAEFAAQQAAPSVPDEWREKLIAEFPLFNDEGLCQEKHHCEWALQQDRKRLHALLQSANHSERNLEMVAPDCLTCANLGRVNGLSQESYCDSCVYQGRDWRKNHFVDARKMVDAVKRRCEACAILPCSCK